MSEADLLSRAAQAIREPLTGDDLRALPIGSAVVTSGGIVWVKHGDEQVDTDYEWGRCNRVGGKFRDSAWLAHTEPRLIYRYDFHAIHAAQDATADWLNNCAQVHEMLANHGPRAYPLAVARAYLGEEATP